MTRCRTSAPRMMISRSEQRWPWLVLRFARSQAHHDAGERNARIRTIADPRRYRRPRRALARGCGCVAGVRAEDTPTAGHTADGRLRLLLVRGEARADDRVRRHHRCRDAAHQHADGTGARRRRPRRGAAVAARRRRAGDGDESRPGRAYPHGVGLRRERRFRRCARGEDSLRRPGDPVRLQRLQRLHSLAVQPDRCAHAHHPPR